jgi:hypothetical protein
VPPTISALTAVTYLCAPIATLPRGSDERLSKHAQEPLRCRDLVGNRFEGRVPPSLLAMRFPGGLLYAPPSSTSSTHRRRPLLSTRRRRPARMCGCSLFPQEGCPLVRYGREGQNKDANDFGVCVAGPVRPLVVVPIGPSLQHAHNPTAHEPPLAHLLKRKGKFVLPTHVRTQ